MHFHSNLNQFPLLQLKSRGPQVSSDSVQDLHEKLDALQKEMNNMKVQYHCIMCMYWSRQQIMNNSQLHVCMSHVFSWVPVMKGEGGSSINEMNMHEVEVILLPSSCSLNDKHYGIKFMLYVCTILIHTFPMYMYYTIHVRVFTLVLQLVVDNLDPSTYVTQSELQNALSTALQQHEETLEKHEATLKSQAVSLEANEKSLQESSNAVNELNGKVSTLEEELNKLMEKMKEVEVSIVCVCDL